MSQTFAELQKNLVDTKGRRTVLMLLVDYLENGFLSPSPEIPPKHTILMDDKVPVPSSVIDLVVSDILKEVAELDEHASGIMGATLSAGEAKGKEKLQ